MPKHANDWVPESPTPAQLKEFFAQIECGRITKSRLQDFLRVKEQLPFKYDKTKDGWKLLEDVPFDGKEFIPELVEFLKPDESGINGEEMKHRAKKLNAHLGQYHAEWLLEHKNKIPKELRGKLLVLPGTVWLDSGGGRRVPCLGWYGVMWCLDFLWLDRGWRLDGCLVSSRKVSGPAWNPDPWTLGS